jgi:SAM-dependent methyltransferase
MNIDDPATTASRRQLIRKKASLRSIYEEWDSLIRESLPSEGEVLEVGSGPGFLDNVITSDVFPLPGLHLALDARRLPFRSNTLRAIVMVDVLHHISRPREFLSESIRVLQTGGRIIMVEPWVSRWSRFIYVNFHHEPFRPDAETWEFPSGGPLSAANGALPWMIFERDRDVFASEFPDLLVIAIRPMMPFRYLLSGGLSKPALAPSWIFPLVRRIESFMPSMAMFAFIVVERR